MTTISAAIVADSISPDGIRLTSIHMRYPRFIHAELMTHRVFSRNARSSRAVPVETMLKEIMTDPVVPLHWGANQKGMQADRECDEQVFVTRDPEMVANGEAGAGGVYRTREDAWLAARDSAVAAAIGFQDAGYHKQVVNRLLEPFMHIDVLVSATEWANFLALRDHHMAEPHIAMLAREVRAAMDGSTPDPLRPGQWHLPYVPHWERDEILTKVRGGSWDQKWTDEDHRILAKVSVARCARISYRPFDGNGSIEAEIARHDALVGAAPMHASPAEHQATPDSGRYVPAHGTGILRSTKFAWAHPHEHGNFRGWRQYRKTLPGENLA